MQRDLNNLYMNNINVIEYPVSHHMLKNYIKYFWVIKSDNIAYIHNKLLPFSNMDLTINLTPPIKYVKSNGLEVRADKYHCVYLDILPQPYCITRIFSLNIHIPLFFKIYII